SSSCQSDRRTFEHKTYFFSPPPSPTRRIQTHPTVHHLPQGGPPRRGARSQGKDTIRLPLKQPRPSASVIRTSATIPRSRRPLPFPSEPSWLTSSARPPHINDIIFNSAMLNGKSILITGASGSLGKRLVDRLLTHYPEITRLVVFSRD